MDYLKERIKALAYKMSDGIRFDRSCSLIDIDITADDLYAINLCDRDAVNIDIILYRINGEIVLESNKERLKI